MKKIPLASQHVPVGSNTELEHLRNIVALREDNVCLLCGKKFLVEDLTLHTVDANPPTLSNTVTVCTPCKVRVIGPHHNSNNRLKLLFVPYLQTIAVRRFNYQSTQKES